MRVLAFGSYDAGAHPRIVTLLEGLREHGLDVDECNVPLRLDTAARVRLLQRPWRLPLLAWQVLRSWYGLWRGTRDLCSPDVVVVGYLGHFDVHLARRRFPHAVLVHDMLIFASDTARDRGAGGLRQRLLSWLDDAAVRASDIIVVDTEEHLALLPAARRGDAVVVPVGAPRAWAAPRPVRRRDDAPLQLVFFGLFTPLQGAPVLGEALALLADEPIEVTMVGTGQDLDRTRAAAGISARVRWVDWLPAEELQRAVAAADVCLGIFGTGQKALRVVPNKVYQGAAAGCAIVTSGTAPQRRAFGDAAVLVPPGDAGALAGALRDLATDRDRLFRLRTAAWDTAQQRFAPRAAAAPLVVHLSTHRHPLASRACR